MTPKLIRQLEIIKSDWTKYKPVTETDKDSKKEMLKVLSEHIEEGKEELLDQEEEFLNLFGEDIYL